MSEYTFERGRTLVLGELETALSAIEPNSVDTLIDAVEAADQVFFVGVGRVLLSLEAMAKRWAHLGIRTHIVGETDNRTRHNRKGCPHSGFWQRFYPFPGGHSQKSPRYRRKGHTHRLQPGKPCGRGLKPHGTHPRKDEALPCGRDRFRSAHDQPF